MSEIVNIICHSVVIPFVDSRVLYNPDGSPLAVPEVVVLPNNSVSRTDIATPTEKLDVVKVRNISVVPVDS